jgi:hypothetical protein
MASGSPSRRRHSSVTAPWLAVVSSKSPGAARSTASMNASAALSRCSQLSSTSSSSASRRQDSSSSGSGTASAWSCRSSAASAALGTATGSLTSASSTRQVPPRKRRMKAIRYHQYGPPSVLRLEDAEPPAVGAGDVLIRVAAASVNPYDWHFLRGTPYLVRGQTGWRRPADPGLGVDLAGRVEAVGRDVTRFTPGDEVFGIAPAPGALAEYAVVPQDRALLPKPANLTFEQAAAVPLAALTALQALRGPGRLQPGQQVLVNGAAGGVGTFAVQLARVMGAEVTGVCGPAHTWLVASLGPQRYDLLLDVAGSRPLRVPCARSLPAAPWSGSAA